MILGLAHFALAAAWKHHLGRLDDDKNGAGSVRLRKKTTQKRRGFTTLRPLENILGKFLGKNTRSCAC